MKPIGPDMICTKPWKVSSRAPGFPGIVIPDVEVGQRLGVETVDFTRDIAMVHFGGMLRGNVRASDLVDHARIAEPEELRQDLKRCTRCGKIEIQKDVGGASDWMAPPPCFNPRKGVTLVDVVCPECDE